LTSRFVEDLIQRLWREGDLLLQEVGTRLPRGVLIVAGWIRS
jgi:hypothetical protein